MANSVTRQMLEGRVERARTALAEHLAVPCKAQPGTLAYRAYWGKHTALNTAYLAAKSMLHQFERPEFDSSLPLFGALVESEVQSVS